MCHLVFALRAHPDFPFVIASNRDEYADRPFRDPESHSDGTLCGIDIPSGGTWLGVHPARGHFAALTNIGGRGRRGGVSRGPLTLAFVRDPRVARERLAARRVTRGFNLVWCEDIRSGQPRLYYASNCEPDDRNGPPSVTALSAEGHRRGRVIGLGNDLLGDEHVKSPFAEREVQAALDEHPRESSGSPAALANSAVALREELARVISHRRIAEVPPAAMLDKFARWSRRRRLQPGTRTALASAAVLGTAASLAGGTALAIGLGVAAGMGAGLWHHDRMQHMFVDVRGLRRRWTTVAQTVMLVDRTGTLHFFARRTVDGLDRAGPWVPHVVPAPECRDRAATSLAPR